jgi:hypothetical protein
MGLFLSFRLMRNSSPNPLVKVTRCGATLRFSPGDGEKREDFTPAERRLILTLARDAEPYILNWLGSYSGARLAELANADTRDIYRDPQDSSQIPLAGSALEDRRLDPHRFARRQRGCRAVF